MFKQCETDFNIERHLIPFLQDCPFFAELSRQLAKVATKDIPTAAVAYDFEYDQVTMFYNPDFLASLANSEVRGILTHEFYHLVFGHLAARRKKPSRLWNVATDLAINSIIVENTPKGFKSGRDTRALPDFALIPGQWPTVMEKTEDGMVSRELSAEEKEGAKMAAAIASFPPLQASEWYFERLLQAAKEELKEMKSKGKGGKGKGAPESGKGEPSDNEDDGEGEGDDGWDEGDMEKWINSMDDHDPWDNVPEEKREYVSGKVKAIVEKAVRHADSQSTGWGNIPAELRSDIRKSVSTVINWRTVLRQFIGNLMRGGRTTSIKRINRRYPYVHPGIKRGYRAKLLIARDESGSVSNEMIEAFFAELSSLTKQVNIDFVPFDCECSEGDIVPWTRGSTPSKASVRTRGGGTDFNAPSRVFNDPKNRGRWDGLLIMTDGVAPKPDSVRGKRGWILADGCKLEFTSDELQVFVEPNRPIEGAWR